MLQSSNLLTNASENVNQIAIGCYCKIDSAIAHMDYYNKSDAGKITRFSFFDSFIPCRASCLGFVTET